MYSRGLLLLSGEGGQDTRGRETKPRTDKARQLTEGHDRCLERLVLLRQVGVGLERGFVLGAQLRRLLAAALELVSPTC